jgi:hypothetical protein
MGNVHKIRQFVNDLKTETGLENREYGRGDLLR